jgi:hypothetical protein
MDGKRGSPLKGGLLALIFGATGLLGVPAKAQAAVAETPTLQARLDAAKDKLNASLPTSATASDPKIASGWGNYWVNWDNWSNWNNWGNFGNWMNW